MSEPYSIEDIPVPTEEESDRPPVDEETTPPDDELNWLD